MMIANLDTLVYKNVVCMHFNYINMNLNNKVKLVSKGNSLLLTEVLLCCSLVVNDDVEQYYTG